MAKTVCPRCHRDPRDYVGSKAGPQHHDGTITVTCLTCGHEFLLSVDDALDLRAVQEVLELRRLISEGA